MLVVARSVPAVLRPVHAPNAQVVTAKEAKEAKGYWGESADPRTQNCPID